MDASTHLNAGGVDVQIDGPLWVVILQIHKLRKQQLCHRRHQAHALHIGNDRPPLTSADDTSSHPFIKQNFCCSSCHISRMLCGYESADSQDLSSSLTHEEI